MRHRLECFRVLFKLAILFALQFLVSYIPLVTTRVELCFRSEQVESFDPSQKNLVYFLQLWRHRIQIWLGHLMSKFLLSSTFSSFGTTEYASGHSINLSDDNRVNRRTMSTLIDTTEVVGWLNQPDDPLSLWIVHCNLTDSYVQEIETGIW